MTVEHSCAPVPRISLAEWTAAGNRNFRFAGHAVFSGEHGSDNAAPLLLIHGFPTASLQERRQFRARWVGALKRATVPLKLIVGGADPISGTHMAERYRALVPNADVTELPGIGHYPQLEAPEEVVEAYLAFRSCALAGQPEV